MRGDDNIRLAWLRFTKPMGTKQQRRMPRRCPHSLHPFSSTIPFFWGLSHLEEGTARKAFGVVWGGTPFNAFQTKTSCFSAQPLLKSGSPKHVKPKGGLKNGKPPRTDRHQRRGSSNYLFWCPFKTFPFDVLLSFGFFGFSFSIGIPLKLLRTRKHLLLRHAIWACQFFRGSPVWGGLKGTRKAGKPFWGKTKPFHRPAQRSCA